MHAYLPKTNDGGCINLFFKMNACIVFFFFFFSSPLLLLILKNMPLTENSFLKVPWETAITLYNNEIVPRVTKKNKRLTISAAIAMALVYFIRDKVFKPPRNIRHISYLSYLGSSISALLSQSIWDRAYAAHIPEIDRVDGNGLFVV